MERESTPLFSALAERLVAREIRAGRILKSIAFLQSRSAAAVVDEVSCPSPIFVLSAGWRSGSTLLQRLLCSGNRILMWGEPFGDRIPAARLARMIDGLRPDDPHLQYTIDRFAGDLSKQWVANLNPGIDALRPAHLAFFEELLARPAQMAGAARWGAKWVRLTAAHAAYLRWLYPQAKFLFLVRHPLHAYLSYKGKRWYTVRPDHQVTGVIRFMAHWRYLAESFVRHGDALGALLVRYEDLLPESEILERIAEFVGSPIRRDVLVERVGGRDKTGLQISGWDRMVCRFLTGSIADRIGYGPRGEVRAIDPLRSFEPPREMSPRSTAGSRLAESAGVQ